jgi:predicted DNA-binding WGR domain protein
MELSGVYAWEYAGGSFPVVLRPNGVFYCKGYAAAATWTVEDGKVMINWGRFGNYQMVNVGDNKWDGSLIGYPEKWRKMSLTRPLNAGEVLMVGDGGGSAWDFQWEGGKFEVQFFCDGFNHFVCPQYPAHSHWEMDENSSRVYVNWGKYGEYELVLDANEKVMTGHKKGQPENWRRAVFLRGLSLETIQSSAHDHAHTHEHGESCGHSCGHAH